MEKEFIPYEQALELKELGFEDKTNSLWVVSSVFPKPTIAFSSSWLDHNKHEKHISAPLYQQTFRWFREKYNLDSSVIREKVKVDGKWIKSKFYIYSIENNDEFPISLGFDLKDDSTYEEAELECLKQLIKIVKDGK